VLSAIHEIVKPSKGKASEADLSPVEKMESKKKKKSRIQLLEAISPKILKLEKQEGVGDGKEAPAQRKKRLIRCADQTDRSCNFSFFIFFFYVFFFCIFVRINRLVSLAVPATQAPMTARQASSAQRGIPRRKRARVTPMPRAMRMQGVASALG
jgi:hypothetical protein